MKPLLIAIFTLFYFNCKSQEVAVKTKTFYWGTPEHNFHQQLTENGKELFDLIFKIHPFDTVNCVRLKSEDLLEFTSRKYLYEHRYDYITVYKQNGIISIKEYSNNLITQLFDNKKVLLRYSKDSDNQIDRISLHIIN